MDEIWKDIKGWEGKYQISNLGRIKSIRYSVRVNKTANRILVPATNRDGYKRISFHIDESHSKSYFVHRLVAEAFICEKPNGKNINHINGIKDDNRVDNLEWTTQLENKAHAKKMGLVANGLNGKHQTVFSIWDIIEIRYWYNLGARISDLAMAYDSYNAHIFSIVNYKIWKQV